MPARAGGDQSPVGAERDRADASGGRLSGQALGVAEPLDVVPLPAAALDRAAVEQVLGQGDVVVLHLAIGPVDPVDVILPGQVLGLFRGDLGLLIGDLGLFLGNLTAWAIFDCSRARLPSDLAFVSDRSISA